MDFLPSKRSVALKSLVIVGLALFPAGMALFQLGAGLAAVETMKMEGKQPGPAPEGLAVIGRFETDPKTNESSIQIYQVPAINIPEGVALR